MIGGSRKIIACVGIGWLLLDVSALATKGKGHERQRKIGVFKSLALGLGANSSAGSLTKHNPVADRDLTSQLDYHQSELHRLIHDEKAMEARFSEFAIDLERDYMVRPKTSDGTASDSTSGAICKIQHESECVDRYEAFKQNVEVAYARNLAGQGVVVHGITKFMDYTPGEFARYFTGLDSAAMQKSMMNFGKYRSNKGFLVGTAVGSKDWRAEGIITPIKDQGKCGSCWAHSVVEQTESMAIKAGQVPKGWTGSPQELVSCDKGAVDNGCNGGSTLFGFNYLLTHGLESEKDYPYTSGTTKKDGACKIEVDKEVIESAGEGSLFESENEMAQYMLSEGPISIAVDASKWSTYVSGIFPMDQCDGKIDHAVQAVALNKDADRPYWVVRNSWNTDWGEDGYIRLPYGVGACSLDEMPATWDTKKVSASQKTINA